MQLDRLKEYNGIYFDPETGMTYRSDGSNTGYTFERATWTGPFGLHFSWPWLNPIACATRETAFKMLLLARAAAPSNLELEVDETDRIVGPFTRTPERMIVVRGGDNQERYSAGWLANSVIRRGKEKAAESWLAELRVAGFAV